MKKGEEGHEEATKKWRKTMEKKYGGASEYMKKIGSKGGSISTTGGFASKKVGKDGLTGRERAKKFGALGGKKSRRGSAYNKNWEDKKSLIKEMVGEGYSMAEISRRVEIPYGTLVHRLKKEENNAD